jgi:hypothetical protein
MQAIRAMERTLAQGPVGEQALAETQDLLRDDMVHPALLIWLRGMRAHEHHWFTELAAGRASLAQAKELAAGNLKEPGVAKEIKGVLARHEIKPAHAWLVRCWTRAVEIAKRPGTDTEKALQELEATKAEAPELARLPVLAFKNFLHLNKGRAVAGCAHAALAVERFRMQHGQWPETLTDVVAARLLAEVPLDPYDGKPLWYRPTADGVVIHSVGPNGDYIGDAWDRHGATPEVARLEFRLWNVDRRGLTR